MIPVNEWRPVGGLILEPNALLAATERQRCLALTAGPGAGKTEMLAQRADFLLRTGTCRYPKRILAISFKVDASRNLKDRVRRRCGPELSSRFDSYTFHAFAKRIIDRFRPVLTGGDTLEAGYKIGSPRVAYKQIEFSDLVPLAVKILKSSSIARNAVRLTYSDIFLDEFQDCTNHQYELVKVAFQGSDIRLTAVGDTKQKIMGWAGAVDGIFGIFSQDFAALPLNMYRNFRSKPVLLRMQNEIIRRLDPASVMPDDQLIGEGGEIYAWRFADCSKEAEYLAELIEGWIRVENVPPAEVAVLLSKQLELYAGPLMAALESRGIPYRNEQQLQDITVEPAARLIVDYLSCVYGGRSPKAWVGLMAQLTYFADDDEIESTRRDFYRFIRGQRKAAASSDFVDDKNPVWWTSVRIFLKKVGIGVLTALSPDYESRSRLVDVVNETKACIERLLKTEPDLVKALDRFSDDQAVRILTIHKSKGLEFDSVIIMAIENEIFFGDQDANRCAFFVGVSRAKRRLVLTHADRRERPAAASRWDVSRSAKVEYFEYATPFVVR